MAFMALLDFIQREMGVAMKARDELRLNTLRSIKTALDRYRVDQRKPVDQEVEIKVLSTLAKQRQEAAEAFDGGNRPALAVKERAEQKIIESLLPELIDEGALDQLIRKAITDTGAVGPKAMGAVIKSVKERLAGKRVDGKTLSDKVKAVLVS